MSDYRYEAFISYRHLQLDMAVAKRLHTLIETYHIPANVQKTTGKKKMGKVFRDEDELPLAVSLSDNIQTALRESEWLIVICTPSLPESRWCMFEIDYFISLGRRDKILLVLADGTPSTSFPKQLCEYEDNGRITTIEPLAANIVSPDTGASLHLLQKEKLRILAPILGVDFDDLKRRARQRKIRLAALIAASVLLAGAALGVFLTVNHARSEKLKLEAAEQARIAEEERARADEERTRAEEEQRQKELERENAIRNDLGERLERASAALNQSEKRTASSILLEALNLSNDNGNIRHDEITALLRKALYIEPFTIISSFNNQNTRLGRIVVSPDGSRAISIVNSNSVAVIDLNTNEILYQVSQGNAMITGLSFSPDGSRFLARCDYARTVTVWNTEDGSEAFTYTSKKNQQYHIANAYFWKDEKTLLVQDMKEFYLVSDNGSATLFYTLGEQAEEYDVDSNFLTFLTYRPVNSLFTLHNNDYIGTPLLLSEDHSRMVIGGMDGSTPIIVLDDNGKKISLLGIPDDPSVYMPATVLENWSLSPDGKTVSCLSNLGFIASWDTETGKLLQYYQFESVNGFDSSDIAYSPDSKRAAYTAENALYIEDARTGKVEQAFEIEETSFTPSVSFSSDGNYLLFFNQDIFILNTSTWDVELNEPADLDNPYTNITPLIDTFLITKNDGSAYFYSMPEISSIQTSSSFNGTLCDTAEPYPKGATVSLKGEHKLSDAFFATSGLPKNTVPSTIYSRDLSHAALLYADGTIELFDTNGDGSVLKLIGELTSQIRGAAMSESILAASDQSARLLLYDLDKQSVQAVLKTGAVYSDFAFSSDGTLLMALHSSKLQIDVYSLETAELLFSMKTSSGSFDTFAFSADNTYAVGHTTTGEYMIGSLWTDESELIERAKLITKR